MKTKQQIEQLAEKECTHHFDLRIGYFKGYTQCQEDMADKKYTEEDMFKLWLRCRVNSDEQQLSYELFKNFINSLNKQD